MNFFQLALAMSLTAAYELMPTQEHNGFHTKLISKDAFVNDSYLMKLITVWYK